MASLDVAELALFFTHDTSLADWHHGGMLDRELALYKALDNHLGSVRFVTYGRKYEAPLVAQLPDFEITFNRYNLPARVYEAYLRDWFPLWKRPPDVIKSNQIPGADIALRAARRLGAKFIARCGYLFSDFIEREYGEASQEADQARQLEQKVFLAADHVVVTTEAIRTRVVGQYALPGEKVTVIPNFVSTDKFAPLTNARQKQPFRIIYVGRLEHQKNLETFLLALEGLEVEVTLVGDGSLRANLEQIALHNKLTVRFFGNVPNQDLPELMNQSDLFVLPSHYEGHPKALLEAMSCGLPVIGTNVPGIREIIRHGENGYLAEPTVESLRAAIQDVLSEEAIRDRIAVRARDYIIENVSLDKIVTLELALLNPYSEEELFMPGASENIVSDQVVLEAVEPVSANVLQRSVRALIRLLLPLLAKMPTAHVRGLIYEGVLATLRDRPPDEKAQFLMRLDNDLYPLHGQAAIDYDGGLHSKHRLINYHDFFVERVEPDQKVLDIGCGLGAVAYDLAAKSNAQVLGLDLNQESIEAGKQRFQHPNLNLQAGDALVLETRQPFDVIILSNVLEHLPDRASFLSKIKQHTRAKRFLIRVPVFERDWRVAFKRELGLEWRLDPTHETEYTLGSFHEEMDKAGLKITHLEVRWGEIWSELVPDGS